MTRLCIIQYNKYNLQERDKYPRIFFYKQLKRKLEEKGYKVILFKSDYPKEINDILDKQKIDLIINFEDYYIRYSRHFHSNLNLADAYKFYQLLEEKNIKIYPPPRFHIYTNSKEYALELYKHTKFVLPHSKTFLLKYYENNDNTDNKKEKTKIEEHINKLSKICVYTLIKVSYSADMVDIFFIKNNDKSDIKLPLAITNNVININELDKVFKLYDKYLKFDKRDLIIIIQPYNSIVANRETEYRMWYLNSKFVGYFCFGIVKNEEGKVVKLIYNVKYDNSNKIHKHLLDLADKIYNFINNEVKKILNKPDFKLLALRIDMSYATDDIFQDEYSVILEDGKKYRFYCNELENIDGTFYLNLPILDPKTNKKYEALEFQNKLVNILVNNLT